jgi:predicted PurR-regulated permease PerM
MKTDAGPALPAAVSDQEVEQSLDLQTTVLCWIAGLLVAGAAWLMASILVPIAVALTLSIAFSPLARRLERLGLGRTGAALACLGLVTAILLGAGLLLAYQAGSIIQHSGEHLDRFGELLARTTTALGGDRLLNSLGAVQSAGESGGPGTAGGGGESEVGTEDLEHYWQRSLKSGLRMLGGWLVRGIGGLVGVIGSAVICLSFVFYFLETRSEWIDRILRMLFFLGMRPRRESLERVKHAITRYGGSVVMISILGMIITGTTGRLIGIPQPFLWGLIFGMLEFVPYFGPMVGGTMMSVVAVTSGGGELWRAAVMLGVILTWLTLEGYVITPMLYGRAVRFDSVMVLVAVLFFGWLWGPLGMVTALPMMVLLRELVGMAPETPALDVLLEP